METANTKTVLIPNITCNHCVMTIVGELKDLDGVEQVTGDAASKKVTVNWSGPADWNLIVETLDEIGYPASQESV